MRKSKLVLAMSALLPGVAFSAPPEAFDSWSLNTTTGEVTSACDTVNFTCSTTPITDSNFIQIQMTEKSSGKTFFKTIIATDDGAGGTFSSESFVGSGTGGGGGIAAKQSLNSDQGGKLASTTTLLTGDFNTGENQVSLSQGIADPATAPTFYSGFTFTKSANGVTATTNLDQQIVESGQFADSFSYTQVKDSGAVTSTALDIVSGVTLNAPGSVADQTFRYGFREGLPVVTGAGGVDLPNGTSESWVAGEAVERVLVGQSVTDAGDFGYERVANVTGGTEVTDFSLVALAPLGTETGVDPFGAPGDPTQIQVTTLP